MDIWSGAITFPDGSPSINDIHISCREADKTHVVALLVPNARLSFLAVVDPSRIPLHLTAGSSLDVWTQDEDTEAWFNGVFLPDPQDGTPSGAEGRITLPWWESSSAQADIAILLRVGERRDEPVQSNGPSITELLLYGTVAPTQRKMDLVRQPESCSPSSEGLQEEQGQHDCPRSDARKLTIRALPLSSDLLYNPSLAGTRGVLPKIEEPDALNDAHFLPDVSSPQEHVSTLKRRRAASLLEDVAERRKKAKRNRSYRAPEDTATQDGVGVCEPRLARAESIMSLAGASSSAGDSQPRRLSSAARREMSSAQAVRSKSTRPSTASSSFSRVTDGDVHIAGDSHAHPTAPSPGDPSSPETRNKESLSKIIMAGMRLYGLQQPGKRPTTTREPQQRTASFENATSTPAQSPSITTTTDNADEYKLIYHQTFKGACFALRRSITRIILPQDHIRDIVDKLLSLFCSSDPPLHNNDPLPTPHHHLDGSFPPQPQPHPPPVEIPVVSQACVLLPDERNDDGIHHCVSPTAPPCTPNLCSLPEQPHRTTAATEIMI